MSINQEELTTALQEALGGQPSSEEGLDYARRILHQEMSTPGMDTSGVDELRKQQEGVLGALQQARKRLMEAQGPTRAEKMFAIAAGLGQPTATGAIGETAANVSRNLLPIAQEQRKFEASRDAALSELDLAESQVMAPVTQAELDLQKLEYEQRQQNMREALKTVSRGHRGSVGSATREAKIADLVNLSRLNRRDASALVDGFVNIEIVPELGTARLINEIDHTVVEVPIGAIKDYIGPDGRPLPTYRPDPSSSGGAFSGEVDTRTEEERAVGLGVEQAFRKGASLWDMADPGSGLVSEVLAGLSIGSATVGGPIADETMVARQGLRMQARNLVRAMVDNPKMPVALVEMALQDASVQPSILNPGPVMQANMIALDAFLYQKYLDYRKYAEDTTAPQEIREAGATNARVIGSFLRDMNVPIDRRQRSPYVPMDPADEASMPSLDDVRPPPGITVDQWSLFTQDEKTRYLELLEQTRGAE